MISLRPTDFFIFERYDRGTFLRPIGRAHKSHSHVTARARAASKNILDSDQKHISTEATRY